jgi:hypothetical protein
MITQAYRKASSDLAVNELFTSAGIRLAQARAARVSGLASRNLMNAFKNNQLLIIGDDKYH